MVRIPLAIVVLMLSNAAGYGDWSSEGCNTSSTDTQAMCQCDHLTSFAILLVTNDIMTQLFFMYIQDTSPTIEPTERTGLTLFLDSITYIGIVVSLVCLTLTVISYLASKLVNIQICL